MQTWTHIWTSIHIQICIHLPICFHIQTSVHIRTCIFILFIYLFIYLFFIYLFIYFLFIYLFNYLFWEGSRVSEGHFPKVLRFSYFPSKLHGLRRRDFQRMISEHIICRFVLNWKPSSLFFFISKLKPNCLCQIKAW